jgi:hypothetical protein
MKFVPTLLSNFQGDILVRCPRCAACSHLIEVTDEAGRNMGSRLVCPICAVERDWLFPRDRAHPFRYKGPHLPGFDLDLWLQVPCCGQTLWAFNEPHIDFMERFISAKLRERDLRGSRVGGWGCCRNSSLESRLPRWMQIGKNRETVLKSLGLLRERLRSAV